MSPDPQRIAAAIAGLGPGGVRIAQLMAVRRDLFAPAVADALTPGHATDVALPAAALATVAGEVGPAHAALLARWNAVPEPNPLLWTAQGCAGRREIRVRVVLPDRLPSAATIAAAIRLAAPLLPAADRDAARASLGDDLARWIAADRGAPASHARLALWRRQALSRTGTIVARPIDGWASAHVVGLAVLPGLPLPAVVALAANGDPAALDEHDIDPRATASRLIEAALEQALLFGSAPVEARLDHLAVLPGNRIARIDAGVQEPLSAPLKTALPAIARAALSGDPALVAARLVALLVPGPAADPGKLAGEIERVAQRLGDVDASLARSFDDALGAARICGHRVPADLLALGRWLATMGEAAIDIDPAIDIGEAVHGFLLRRGIEEAVALPDSMAAARRLLALVAPMETLPGRLDRLLADATNRHYRLPVEQHRSPVDRQLRTAQARLVAVAVGWTGVALLLLVIHDWPAGLARSLATALLWAAAATAATLFPMLWRRSA